MRSFPAQFLADIPESKDYRKAMDFLPSALAARVESYQADQSPGPGKKRLADLSGLDMHGVMVCDYFAPLGVRMLAVEDTRLVRWVAGRLKDLGDEERADELAEESRGKAEGSANILGALYEKFAAEHGWEKNPPQAECEFWVVITDIDDLEQMEETLAFENVVEDVRDMWESAEGRLSPPYVFAEIARTETFAAHLESRLPAE